MSDTAGNAWDLILQTASGGGHSTDVEIWEAPNANSVSSITVTTSFPTPTAIRVMDIGGVAKTSPLDTGTGATGLNGTTLSSGSSAPTTANEFSVAALSGHGNNKTITPAAGFTSQSQVTGRNGAGAFATLVTGEELAMTTNPFAYTGTVPKAEEWGAFIVFWFSSRSRG